MKRIHVHASVDDLASSIAFYSALFAAEPTRVEKSYAKWLLDDPRVHFALSSRGGAPGVDHLGIEADDEHELAELKARAEAAGLSRRDEHRTTCCYARSDKHWIIDPQGIAWEHFHTLADIPRFRETGPAPADVGVPAARAPATGGAAVVAAGAGCCR